VLSCICVLVVSMLSLSSPSQESGRSCICVLGVSGKCVVMYLCVRGVRKVCGHVFVC